MSATRTKQKLTAPPIAMMLGDCAATVSKTFDLIGIAEDEIRRAGGQRNGSEVARRVWGTFKSLYPGKLSKLDDRVYRHHCRELIGRSRRGESLRPGTEAEVLLMLSETSLRSPLNRQGIALYEVLFLAVFGSLPDNAKPTPEPWPGATKELLTIARMKLKVDR